MPDELQVVARSRSQTPSPGSQVHAPQSTLPPHPSGIAPQSPSHELAVVHTPSQRLVPVGQVHSPFAQVRPPVQRWSHAPQ
jgi:hypothetical protein